LKIRAEIFEPLQFWFNSASVTNTVHEGRYTPHLTTITQKKKKKKELRDCGKKKRGGPFCVHDVLKQDSEPSFYTVIQNRTLATATQLEIT
jgi:hypothetical protein